MADEDKKPADAGSGAEDGKGNEKPPEENTFSEEYVKKLRGESRGRRIRIRELEQENEDLTTELAKANKGQKAAKADELLKEPVDNSQEVNEWKDKASKYEQQARLALLKTSFAIEATKHGVADPEMAFRLIKQDDKRLDLDLESGSVDGMDEVVSDLIKNASWIANKTVDPKEVPPADSAKGPGAKSPATVKPEPDADLQKSIDEAMKTGGVRGAQEVLAAQRASKEANK